MSQQTKTAEYTQPAIIAIVGLPLLGGLAAFSIYISITDPSNREIFLLSSVILLIGFIANLITVLRHRVVLFEDRIEYRGLWDGGVLKRDEISSIRGLFRTKVIMRDGHAYRIPYIRRMTSVLRTWHDDDSDFAKS